MFFELITNRRSIRQFKIASIMAMGHPDMEKVPHPKESLQTNKIHLNTFNKE